MELKPDIGIGRRGRKISEILPLKVGNLEVGINLDMDIAQSKPVAVHAGSILGQSGETDGNRGSSLPAGRNSGVPSKGAIL